MRTHVHIGIQKQRKKSNFHPINSKRRSKQIWRKVGPLPSDCNATLWRPKEISDGNRRFRQETLKPTFYFPDIWDVRRIETNIL